MPEQGTSPVNQYLPPRARDGASRDVPPLQAADDLQADGFLGWLDRALDKLG